MSVYDDLEQIRQFAELDFEIANRRNRRHGFIIYCRYIFSHPKEK